MTDQELQLCRKLAEAEGKPLRTYCSQCGCNQDDTMYAWNDLRIHELIDPPSVHGCSRGVWEERPHGDQAAYLTDPAETVRMVKELLLLKWNGREFIGATDGGWIKRINVDCDLEHAVAEAYLAMLVEKEGK